MTRSTKPGHWPSKYDEVAAQQAENIPILNLCKEKGIEVVVEKVNYQQQLEKNLYMKRLQILENLSPEASKLKRKNLLHRMEMLDRKKLQLGKGSSSNSSDGKQKDSAGPDEDDRTRETQELHRLDPKRLRRMRNKRIYSQRYRLKQELKKLDLEDTYKRLVENTKAVPDMILHYDDRKARLKNENDALRRKIADLTKNYYKKAALVEMRRQELRELRELYNLQLQASLMQRPQQQAQQYRQTQLMPAQPFQPCPYDYLFLSNIFF